MWMWILCVALGIISLASLPAFLGFALRILAKIGKKYPRLADVGAVISFLILLSGLLLIVYVFAVVYHYIFVGHL
jgi:hypothetical protein